VARLDDYRQDRLRRVVALDHDHLRAWNHDVAHLRIRDLQHSFDHR
jgi:hypothetical protein